LSDGYYSIDAEKIQVFFVLTKHAYFHIHITWTNIRGLKTSIKRCV